MLQWLKAHKVLIAVLGLLGSVAGVGISAVDLKDALKARKRLKG